MQVKGGNTAESYQGDGRLEMSRSLERLWPGIVTTIRRWERPQHKVRSSWRLFDTPLRLRAGVELEDMQPNEYGLALQQVKEIRSAALRQLLEDSQHGDD